MDMQRSDGARFSPQTINMETRTVDAVFSTENPVTVFDPFRHEHIPEILLASGMRSGESVRMIDSHNRSTVKNVLGSAVPRVEDNQIVGSVRFAKSATDEFEKMQDGHITDFSVGYRISEADSTYIGRDEKENISGREFSGPVVVRTAWDLKELSLVVVGADPAAKARAEDTIKKEEQKGDKKMENDTEKKVQEEARQEKTVVPLVDTGAIVAAERSRITDINDLARELNMDFTEYINSDTPVSTVREIALKAVIERNKVDTQEVQHAPAIMQVDERDKFRSAMTDGFEIRLGRTPEKPAQGAYDLAGYSLREVCRHIVKINNLDRSGNPSQIVVRAMATDDFDSIMSNVMNKSLFAGFETQPETYETWADTSGSTNDFKQGTIAKISGTSGLTEIPEGSQYNYGTRTDGHENFQVLTYGEMLAFTRQAIINDDLGALNDNMKQLGEDVKIQLGDLAYAVLTANAAMNDGVALFNATHSNMAAGGDLLPPGIGSLAEGIRAMKVQTGLQGLKRLNIRPVYFLAPVELEGSSEILFRTGNFSDHSTVATDSTFASTRVNPYSGNYFTRVYEARLDANSTAFWYLLGPKGKTIKMFFLHGQKSPYMETKAGWTTDGIEMKIRIDATAAPIDHRAMYLNPDT